MVLTVEACPPLAGGGKVDVTGAERVCSGEETGLEIFYKNYLPCRSLCIIVTCDRKASSAEKTVLGRFWYYIKAGGARSGLFGVVELSGAGKMLFEWRDGGGISNLQ